VGGAAFFAAWGEPTRPGFPPQGETGKGATLLPEASSLYLRINLTARNRRVALLPFALCVEPLCSGALWCPQSFQTGAAISASNWSLSFEKARSAGSTQSPERGDLR
jgi:hypothetical protein